MESFQKGLEWCSLPRGDLSELFSTPFRTWKWEQENVELVLLNKSALLEFCLSSK